MVLLLQTSSGILLQTLLKGNGLNLTLFPSHPLISVSPIKSLKRDKNPCKGNTRFGSSRSASADGGIAARMWTGRKYPHDIARGERERGLVGEGSLLVRCQRPRGHYHGWKWWQECRNAGPSRGRKYWNQLVFPFHIFRSKSRAQKWFGTTIVSNDKQGQTYVTSDNVVQDNDV